MKDKINKRRIKKKGAALRPKADEFVAVDADGNKVNGRYDENGNFKVEPGQ